MTIDKKVRHDLYEGLEKIVGETPAKLLMTAIPPFSWDNVATKLDFAELKGDLNGGIDLLREDLKSIRSELKDIRSEIRDVRQEMVREHRWLLFQFLAVNLSMVTIVLAFVAMT